MSGEPVEEWPMTPKLLSCLSCWQMYSPIMLTKGTWRHSCATACLGMTAGARLGRPFHQLTNGLLHYSQLFSPLCSLAYVFPLLLRATLHRRILPILSRTETLQSPLTGDFHKKYLKPVRHTIKLVAYSYQLELPNHPPTQYFILYSFQH